MTLKKNIAFSSAVEQVNHLAHNHATAAASGPIPSQSSSPTIPEPMTFALEPTNTVIPAGHGFSAPMRKGTHFRLVDVYGSQVIDMTAFVLPFSPATFAFAEHLSPSYTRFRTGGQPISVGECLYTNMDEPLFKLVGDTVKTHDMTFMSCFPKLYEGLGLNGHRSCAQNMVEALSRWGMQSITQVKDPFNVFQNTPAYTLKPLNTSRSLDWCEWEVLKDCVAAWSCCPYDINGFNGGSITDVLVVTGIPKARNGLCSDWEMDEKTKTMLFGS